MRRRSLLQAAFASTLASPALAQDRRAATLRFVPQANLSVVDPIWTTATITGLHGAYVFDTLYAVDDKLKPQPQMAEGHEVSDDGLTWRIRLREGLRFHDNEPVRATDCIASLKRWAAREPSGQLLAAAAESWTALDDRTMQIQLTRPFLPLLDAIGKADTSCAYIMPERLALTDPAKQVTEMVGSGPFRFVPGEFNSGSRVVYEKFAGYVPRSESPVWGTGAKLAHFDRVEWLVIPDASTAAAALRNNEVDWVERPGIDLLPQLAASKNIKLPIADPSGRMAILRFNSLQPPFNDPRLRQAVRLAVNQEDYMRAARGEDTSTWSVCRSLWPEHTAYYRDAGAAVMPASLDQAKAALEAAGYAGQTVVILNPTDNADIGPLGYVTADLLKRMGMTVDLRDSDWGTVVQRRASREAVEKGGWSIFHTTGPAVGLADPAMSYTVRGQGSSGWTGWWGNTQAEALTQEWLNARNPEDQRKAAETLGTLALDQAGTIPLGQFVGRTAYRADLTGVLPGPLSYPWSVRRV